MEKVTIRENIEKLEGLFDVFNEKYYKDQLIRPVIAFIPNTGNRRVALGWCTVKKIWHDTENKRAYYEISICPEFMDRDIKEISGTLLHEMVHLYNLKNGIQDCSRGGQYHNKKFKEEAEKRGLTIEFDKRIGWSLTKLNNDSSRFIETELDIHFTPLCRGGRLTSFNDDEEEEEEKKKKSWKYVCPSCENSVRATKELHVICGDCRETMEEET